MVTVIKEFQLVDQLFLRGENHAYVLAKDIQGFEVREVGTCSPVEFLIVAVTSNGNSYPMSYPHRANHLEQLQVSLREAVRLLAGFRQLDYAASQPFVPFAAASD